MLSRIKAFLVHVAVSAFIGLITLWLVFFAWYPAPLEQALGVTQIFLLLLIVDIILGPCLTFLVFKPGKKKLVFDLAIICLFQVSALGYGIWAVFSARPAWLVFNVDRFDVVQAVDIDARKIDEAWPEFRTASWFSPRWVGAIQPEVSEQRQAVMFEAILYGSDIAHRPNLYRPLSSFSEQIKKKAMSLEKLRSFNNEEAVRKKLASWPEAKYWVPLKAREKSMVVLLTEDASVLGIAELNPWD